MYSIDEVIELFLSLNLIHAMYYVFSSLITVLGILLNYKSYIKFYLPEFVSGCYTYGKISNHRNCNIILQWIEVPKRWFLHFYYAACTMAVLCCILFWHVTCNDGQLPESIESGLSFLTTKERYVAVSSLLSWISLLLYSSHVLKRLYECCYLSVFSNASMNVIHYILGHSHYFGAFVGLVSLFPGFASQNKKMTSVITAFHSLSWIQVFSIGVIIIASWSQFHSLKILANLRKESKDGNGRNKYFLPVGGLFNYISCPHMLSEMIVYLGLATLMGFQHTTWNVICLFVWCNQIQLGLLNHHWYKDYFHDYPLQRKAIFPFVL